MIAVASIKLVEKPTKGIKIPLNKLPDIYPILVMKFDIPTASFETFRFETFIRMII